MLRVGYIGLGLMGKPMARNILKAGFPLAVHNRSRGAVDELVAEGAKAANSPREVAEQADLIFTNLPDSPDVEKVALGEDGILAGGHSGLIVADNSTIQPVVARRIAQKLKEKDIFFLDAPVSGGDVGAKNATLTIMVGGEAEALEKAMPVLQTMGRAITHVGDSGAGQVAKAANQIMVAAQMVAMGELLVFSKKAGVDPRKVVDAIKGGAAQCWALDVKTPRLFAGNRNPGFKAYMQLKDMKIVLETAKEYAIPLSATEENTKFFELMIEQGMRELDNAAVVGVIEKLAGVEIVD
ncbi:MAG: NAD-binding protein [Anaerolineales bacterium]|nr:NAD-binding protein [Anaerolineales bacterium]MCZ2121732.1 NAD-binding protein [Anaerolineales bacterium]